MSETETQDTTITYDDFAKVELRVATITAAELHPNADRLLKLQIDLGDERRQICAGIRGHYEPDELVGRQITVAGIQTRTSRSIARAIRSAAARVRPGVDERAVLAAFEETCRVLGSQSIPFTPIVKSGPNSLWPWRILAAHYDRRNRQMEAGDLVILDVGCEIDGYVSDVGRTFPVGGVFTDAHREKLLIGTRAADAVIDAIRPGVTFQQLTEVAYEAIPDHEERHMQTSSFFGHHIGMRAGDPALPLEPLQAGMVITVEPWYYNHELGIGVFVEDVVLVTDDGAEVLTSSLPRTPEALAEMVR